MEVFLIFLRTFNLGYILVAILTYSLGGGIAHYLGAVIDWRGYLLGQVSIIFLQLAAQAIDNFFNPTVISKLSLTNRNPDASARSSNISQYSFLFVGFSCLAALASLTVFLIVWDYFSPILILFYSGTVVVSLGYAIPSLGLRRPGYGEFVSGFLIVFLIPCLAFILQQNEIHRLVIMVTVPLFTNFLAMQLALELPGYSSLPGRNPKTMFDRAGWANGILIHNISVLSIYLLLGLAAWVGLPRFVVIPGYLVLPLGIFQLWQMNRIVSGAKPLWTALKITAIAQFVVMSYLFSFAFWTH